MKTHFSIIIFSLFFAGGVLAQSLNDLGVDGVMVYKRYSSDSDARARAVEYRSTVSHSQVTHVFLPGGIHTRVTAVNDATFVPYPGRGLLGRDVALAQIELAVCRYPQHRRLLNNIRNAWVSGAPEESSRHVSVSVARQGWAGEMISAIGRQAVGYVFQARTSMLSTPPSLSEKPTKTPLVSGTLDLEKNLNILKQYYAIASLLAPEE